MESYILFLSLTFYHHLNTVNTVRLLTNHLFFITGILIGIRIWIRGIDIWILVIRKSTVLDPTGSGSATIDKTYWESSKKHKRGFEKLKFVLARKTVYVKIFLESTYLLNNQKLSIERNTSRMWLLVYAVFEPEWFISDPTLKQSQVSIR